MKEFEDKSFNCILDKGDIFSTMPVTDCIGGSITTASHTMINFDLCPC